MARMGFREAFRRAFATAGNPLASAERVAALVPAEASYVTFGQVVVLDDVRAYNQGGPGGGVWGQPLAYRAGPGGRAPEVALLVLAGAELQVVADSGKQWSTEVSRVTDLDGRRSGGFLVFTQGRDGIAVGPQTPVQIPAGACYRTVGGWTNAFCGWDDMLAPSGVRTTF